MEIPYKYQGEKATRTGFGEGLLEAGKSNQNIIGLCADLTGSLKMDKFAKEFPERFFQCGIAEANMISMAAGMTIGGKIPFAGSFANFITGRVYDQIRQSVAYSQKNVKICASHAGLTLGEDGATHQILEDIGLMKMLPNMTVLVPCDANQTKAATIAAANFNGPVYLRFGRPDMPNFTLENQDFVIGKADLLQQGRDVTIIATGHLVWQAVLAAEELKKQNVSAEVINLHTIKPFDDDTVLQSIGKTGCVVTAEEHSKFGGLADSVAQLLALKYPAPLEIVAVNDVFGESGKPQELLKKYGLDMEHITKAVFKAVQRKKEKQKLETGAFSI